MTPREPRIPTFFNCNFSENRVLPLYLIMGRNAFFPMLVWPRQMSKYSTATQSPPSPTSPHRLATPNPKSATVDPETSWCSAQIQLLWFLSERKKEREGRWRLKRIPGEGNVGLLFHVFDTMADRMLAGVGLVRLPRCTVLTPFSRRHGTFFNKPYEPRDVVIHPQFLLGGQWRSSGGNA